ncbi:MAG: RNA polymerase sigma factor [Polaribacter sp.]
MNTKHIIQKCKENNYSAQLEVYNSYKNMMFGSAIRILKNRGEAEDVVQDSFIRGFEKIHQLHEDVNLGAWLKRIVVNKSLDSIRNKKKIVFVDETLILETEYLEIEDDIEPAISIDFIKECINKLKEKYRIILVLYMIEDYNHREIGELLSIKESTVRNQYKRGKEQLLQMLK